MYVVGYCRFLGNDNCCRANNKKCYECTDCLVRQIYSLIEREQPKETIDRLMDICEVE